MYAIAHRLGKTAAEIGDLSVSEFDHWLAYFRLIEKERQQ